MSKAEELLDSLSIEDIQPFTSEPDIEGHIVIDKDRIIHVPTELKRIAVQYDSNIETVTFDCPRYWDEHDLSEMNIYINYKLPGNLINNIGQSLVKNLRINEDDENIINFDWTIGPILTNNKGDLPFSVCAKSKTNQDSDEAIRWYSEINTELTISEGMDGSGDIEDNYEDLFPDVINDIISKLEGINATYDEKLEAFNTNATSKTESFDTNAETKTTEFNNNATTKTNEFNSNAIEKTEAFNTNANGVLKKSNAFINGLMNAALTNEVEGVENVINDGVECPLFKMEVDGHTNEQVVTTGKNKLQLTTFDDGTKQKTINNVTATINDDGTISLNGTASNETQFYLTKNDFSLENGDSYFWCNSPSVNCRFEFVAIIDGERKYLNSYSTTPNTFNITSSFVYSGSTIIVANGTSTNVTLTPMVANGTFTEYEPYTGGQPSPSPDYEQPINSVEGSVEFACRGKNMLDNVAISRTVNGVTFTVNNDKTITINGTATKYTNLRLSDSDNNLIPIRGNYISGGTNNVRFQIMNHETNSYIILASSNSYKSTPINKTQFERGYFELVITEGTILNNEVVKPMMTMDALDSAEYEPYKFNQVTINLNGEKLRSVGDVKDELVVDLETGDYYKVENVVEEIFDGSDDENWGLDGIEEIYTQFIYYNLLTNPIKRTVVKNNYFSDNNDNRIVLSDKSAYIRFPKSSNFDVSDVDKFKLWLQEHNVIGQYSTQKPTTKKLGTLGADQLLKLATLKGYNYMTVTGIVDSELVNLNSRITYIQNANDYREIQNGKIAKMISNHPKQSIEGIDNTFDDAVDMELFELTGDGASEQDTTTGKNLLNYTNIKPTNNGITNTLNDDGSITTTGSANYNYLQILNTIDITDLLEDGQMYTIMQKNATDKVYIQVTVISNEDVSNYIGLGTNLTNTATFTVNKESNKRYLISIQTNTIETSTDINITNYYQLLKGSYDEWQPFEKYTGGQPSPSPDYPQPINSIEGSVDFACRGKNLLNATREEYVANGLTVSFDNSNMYINGAATENGKYIGASYKLGKGTYTLSLSILKGNVTSSNTGAIFYLYEGTSYTLLNKSIILKSNTKGYSTFTLDKETNVSLGLYARTTETFNNVVLQYQVTKGENPDYNFEPYVQPNEVTFNLGEEKLRSVGDVKDELVVDLDTGDYYKVENVREVVLDGSENWEYTDTYNYFRCPNFDFGEHIPLYDKNSLQISNYFRIINDWSTFRDSVDLVGIYRIANAGYKICIRNTNITTTENFKNWLNKNNTIIDYPLATPTTKKLGTLSSEDLAKLKTFKGYNNVTVNTNLGLMNIRFTYGLDIKKYVDNKIAEISTQIIKEG